MNSLESTIKDERLTLNNKMREMNRYLLHEALTAFFDLSNFLNVIVDEDGIILLMNSKWTEILGWDESEVVGKPFTIFVHPEDAKRCISAFISIIRNDQKLENLEIRVMHKHGYSRRLIWNAFISGDGRYGFAVGRLAQPYALG